MIGFRGRPPALHSTYPHPPLLPPEGEAPGVHAYYSQTVAMRQSTICHTRLTRRLVVNRNLHVGFDRLAVAEGWDELRAIEIRTRRVSEAQQRRFLR